MRKRRPVVDGGGHVVLAASSGENKGEVAAITSAGAYVMGRNMFGPVRGEWDVDWRGWWGMTRPITPPCSCSPTIHASR